ncbi:hypothetical protein BZY94_39510 [Burkholderia territorii]|nr:hypothetical protein BZY94_39510 [Burkholderia territorii]
MRQQRGDVVGTVSRQSIRLPPTSTGARYAARVPGAPRALGFAPRACKAYRAKTKGKVERPYRYIRQDFCKHPGKSS